MMKLIQVIYVRSRYRIRIQPFCNVPIFALFDSLTLQSIILEETKMTMFNCKLTHKAIS